MCQATKRKKNFSISMQPKEIKRIDDRVQDLIKKAGFPVSRNELIRRATLAYLDFTDGGCKEDYMEVFKKVGV